MTTVNRRIQQRRGTAENLAATNETPLAGELVVETDTGKFKFGDGVTAWNSLEYATGGLPPSDGKVYVIKDGEYVEATLVDMSDYWSPSIDNSEEIVLAVDNDMTPYQLTGTNTEETE